VGRFHRGSFDEQVTLNRPGASVKTHNAITGVWASSGRVVHIGEQKPGQFAGWSDSLQIPGTIGFAPWIQPHRLLQVYGDRVKVEAGPESQVSFEFGAYGALCCPHPFIGIVEKDGLSIEGRWPPNQTPRSANWRRVTGDRD